MRALLVVALLAGPARAELIGRVQPMTAAEGDVCELLKAERGDTCRRTSQLGNASVYATRRGIRRVVLAIADGDDVLVSPPIDVPAGKPVPTVRAVSLDGRPAVVLDVVTPQTEAIVACGVAQHACVTVDVGACRAIIDPDGAVATTCGGRVRLSLAR